MFYLLLEFSISSTYHKILSAHYLLKRIHYEQYLNQLEPYKLGLLCYLI